MIHVGATQHHVSIWRTSQYSDEEEGEEQEAEARDAIVMEDGEWGLEARKAIREFEAQEQLMNVDGEVVDLDIDDPEQEM